MRDVVQEILHGIAAQKLYLDVTEGRPSSVDSVTVVESSNDDDGPTESAISGVGSVETNPDTTSSANAGFDEADQTTIALTSAVGVVSDGSRSYLFAASNGDSEWVEPIGLSGSTVRLRHPLLNEYASGATFKSTRIQATVDTTWASAEDNLSNEEDTEPRYRVIWVYTIGGVQKRKQTSFDLVRYSANHSVTPLDVDARFPGWIDRLPTDYRRTQGRSLIDQAWRAVKMDLRADGKLGRWVRNVDVVTELVITKANVLAVEQVVMFGGQVTLGQDTRLKTAMDVYRQRYDQLIREPHTQVAAQSMGGSVAAKRAPFFSR